MFIANDFPSFKTLFIDGLKNMLADDQMRKAVELQPENLRYRYVYAVGLNSIGQNTAAVNALEKLLLQWGKNVSAVKKCMKDFLILRCKNSLPAIK